MTARQTAHIKLTGWKEVYEHLKSQPGDRPDDEEFIVTLARSGSCSDDILTQH